MAALERTYKPCCFARDLTGSIGLFLVGRLPGNHEGVGQLLKNPDNAQNLHSEANKQRSGAWFAILAGCVILAFAFVLLALHDSRRWKIPLAISLAYLATAFCSDRLFTSKVKVKTFQMTVALDGMVPWGKSWSRMGRWYAATCALPRCERELLLYGI
jgi:hypothetical protein